MGKRAWRASFGELTGEIVHDAAAGYYLKIYQVERCIADHLQDSLEFAIENASDYGFQPDAWVEQSVA